jgi:hypothetical protein
MLSFLWENAGHEASIENCLVFSQCCWVLCDYLLLRQKHFSQFKTSFNFPRLQVAIIKQRLWLFAGTDQFTMICINYLRLVKNQRLCIRFESIWAIRDLHTCASGQISRVIIWAEPWFLSGKLWLSRWWCMRRWILLFQKTAPDRYRVLSPLLEQYLKIWGG